MKACLALLLTSWCAVAVSPAIAGTESGFVKDLYVRDSDGLIFVLGHEENTNALLFRLERLLINRDPDRCCSFFGDGVRDWFDTAPLEV